MAYRLALLCLLASPAVAQDARLGPPAEAAYATVTVYNGGSPALDATTAFDTELGPVVIRYRSTPNFPCTTPRDCADFVEVVSLPEGVMADPIQAHILEGETLVIQLIEWSGL